MLVSKEAPKRITVIRSKWLSLDRLLPWFDNHLRRNHI